MQETKCNAELLKADEFVTGSFYCAMASTHLQEAAKFSCRVLLLVRVFPARLARVVRSSAFKSCTYDQRTAATAAIPETPYEGLDVVTHRLAVAGLLPWIAKDT